MDFYAVLDEVLTLLQQHKRVKTQERTPLAYTPKHLAERILTSRSALEGERKQATVLFADDVGHMHYNRLVAAAERRSLRKQVWQ